MKTKISYKYINLLIRTIIGLAAFAFIVIKINNYFNEHSFQNITINTFQFSLVVLALLLVFINWGIEAIKWRFLIKKLEKLSLKKAFQLVITGITIGLITPNRVGEIPARVLLLPESTHKKSLLTATFIGAFSQVLATVIVGLIGVYFLKERLTFIDFYWLLSIIIIGIVLLLFYSYFYPFWLFHFIRKIPFLSKKEYLIPTKLFSIQEKIMVLMMSSFRYFIFCLQYYLILEAFGVHFSTTEEMLLIPICFLLSSFIPTFILSEIAVRGSVALFVFSLLSDNDVAILTASILLWVFNVALPASIGIFGLKKFNLFSKA